MSDIRPFETGTTRRLLFRKIDLRVLALLTVSYGFAYLDRVNIGFAKLQMQSSLGLSDAVYGLGAGIFFLGYIAFEIPSNLLLPKLGARKTFSRIMVLWGLTSASMIFVHDQYSFYALRLLLGVFEAGFAPGMIFYLGYWYPRSCRARTMAIVLSASPIAGLVGGPLSGWAMTKLAGVAGFAGWQWLFLVEGLPSIVLGVVIWFCLADRPADARWLSREEKALLEIDSHAATSKQHVLFRDVLADAGIYRMAAAYFCMICGLYAVGFWLPSILKAAGQKDVMTIGLFSALPYAAAIASMYALGRRSDQHRERRWHSAVALLLGAVAFACVAFVQNRFTISLIAITLATALVYAAYTVFWAMASEYLNGDVAAGAIALVNSIGLVGGFLSPTIIGWVSTATGNMRGGLLVMVAILLIGAVLVALEHIPAIRPARAS
ncbi:MFS transporter [Trinickia symbiotica]|uniref:MFS transporter n=1 Tax=Trinickia symbiotica TaxID=863227 RepID=UPI0006886B5F|nr:MFS transporter [Trinickia symbiotica]